MKWELIKAIEEQGYRLTSCSENQTGMINIAVASKESEKDCDIELEEPKKAMTFKGVKWASSNLIADEYVTALKSLILKMCQLSRLMYAKTACYSTLKTFFSNIALMKIM